MFDGHIAPRGSVRVTDHANNLLQLQVAQWRFIRAVEGAMFPFDEVGTLELVVSLLRRHDTRVTRLFRVDWTVARCRCWHLKDCAVATETPPT